MEMRGQLHAPDAFLLYKQLRCPSDGRLGGPQIRSGQGKEEKSPCPCQDSNLGRPALNLAPILTELSPVYIKHILCLINHHDMKTYGGVEVYFHVFLTLASAALPAVKNPPVPTGEAARWTPEPVWTRW